eukprot:TRINITY_DN48913_c0_g1_i1.p4 TRINITY_DN48913_c0_g1~~TRINITY_DN48913_c0_g1_i1.p4  ORF type:complete len:123 (+),score=10.53 TRINITY_DN48913_c0_g1_i1:226-594(+)
MPFCLCTTQQTYSLELLPFIGRLVLVCGESWVGLVTYPNCVLGGQQNGRRRENCDTFLTQWLCQGQTIIQFYRAAARRKPPHDPGICHSSGSAVRIGDCRKKKKKKQIKNKAVMELTTQQVQ